MANGNLFTPTNSHESPIRAPGGPPVSTLPEGSDNFGCGPRSGRSSAGVRAARHDRRRVQARCVATHAGVAMCPLRTFPDFRDSVSGRLRSVLSRSDTTTFGVFRRPYFGGRLYR